MIVQDVCLINRSPNQQLNDQFGTSIQNAQQPVKNRWGNKIKLHYAERDFSTNLIKYKININDIDKYLELKYNKTSLAEAIEANNT